MLVSHLSISSVMRRSAGVMSTPVQECTLCLGTRPTDWNWLAGQQRHDVSWRGGIGAPRGIRTLVPALRGLCPRPLDDGILGADDVVASSRRAGKKGYYTGRFLRL